MKSHHQLLSIALSASLVAAPMAAQADVFSDSDIIELSQNQAIQVAVDRRENETLRDLKRDPARAALLSVLYPGLGQMYVGNDQNRSLWIMGGGTVVVVGSIVGFGLLSGRPPEASTLGNLMILGTLLGYHLWNIRDAYVQAVDYNTMLEKQNRVTWLDQFQVGVQQERLTLSWSSTF